MKTVYVVCTDSAVMAMFASMGYHPIGGGTKSPERNVVRHTVFFRTKIDLVCFTGGEDVSPHLYGEENIHSYCNPIRDEFEKQVYESYVGKVPMVGICRGGQFLNVMNGGKMIQHINGHSMGTRRIISGYGTGIGTDIREDHHQGMVPSEILASDVLFEDPRDQNPEVIWYKDTKCLCFQPHPEWGHNPTKDLFFQLIKEYIDA